MLAEQKIEGPKMKLQQKLESVLDETSFLEFVDELRLDFENGTDSSHDGPTSSGWENVTIPSYLDAISCWARDSVSVQTENIPSKNLWRRFADLLMAGKYYE